jgi:hypothetical protein
MIMELLLQLLISLTSQIGPISALITKMKTEGRTELTTDEWATINAGYATAHTDAVAALAEARAAGR